MFRSHALSAHSPLPPLASARTVRRAPWCLAVLVALVCTGTAWAQTPDHDAILEATSAFSENYAAGDIEAIAATFVEDALYVVSDGTVLEGTDGIAALFTSFQDADFVSLDLEPMKVRVSGDMAYSFGGWTLTHASDTTQSGYYSIVHERTDGGWRIAHIGNTPIAEDPEGE